MRGLQSVEKSDTIQVRLDPAMVAGIEQALEAGYLVEIIRLRDGTIKARTVKKKEIKAPTA